MSITRVSWPRMSVGNVLIDLVDRDQAMALIRSALSDAIPLAVLSANLHHIHLFADDPTWTDRTSSFDAGPDELHWLTLADGMPLIRKAKKLTGRPWPRLAGSDLLEPVLSAAAELQLSVGFLGGSVETHRRLRSMLEKRMPELCVAGTWAPERCELDNAMSCSQIAREISLVRVDVLVVALGKPTQENWIAGFGDSTGATLLLPFGAALDFVAGTQMRAPRWTADFGLEWFWRLIREPRRLWRRYLIECPPAWIRVQRDAELV